MFQGATRLRLCEECKNGYGSCDLFDDYTLSVRKVSVPYLRSKNAVLETEEDWQQVDDEFDDCWDYFCIDSLVVFAPGSVSQDPFWLIRIIEKDCIANSEDLDCYGNKIVRGKRYLKGHFVERMHSGKNSILYKQSKMVTYFYK